MSRPTTAPPRASKTRPARSSQGATAARDQAAEESEGGSGEKVGEKAEGKAASPARGTTYDVIVVGGGPAGLTMTALLASQGLHVLCVDREPPLVHLDGAFDGRTTAISFGSRAVLKAAGVWDDIVAQAAPIETIQILDGDSPVLLNFGAHEVNAPAFGWIVENRLLRRALMKRVAALPHAAHLAPAQVADFTVTAKEAIVHLQDGTTLDAQLVIGADGRQSFTRQWMGIDSRGWSYNQRALVCTVTHTAPHKNIAIEHFRGEGPFAILPMPDDEDGRHRSSVVWTEHVADAESALHYDAETFNRALQTRFPDWYGTVAQIGKRFAFPLSLIHAHDYIAPRMALVADAAHGIHPIAGQGLNLGFRDIAALAHEVVNAHKAERDCGAPETLAAYQSARRLDNMAMAGTTDILNRLFSNNSRTLGLARKAGLSLVSRLPVAKKFFMKQAMGAAGILPGLIAEGQARQKTS